MSVPAFKRFADGILTRRHFARGALNDENAAFKWFGKSWQKDAGQKRNKGDAALFVARDRGLLFDRGQQHGASVCGHPSFPSKPPDNNIAGMDEPPIQFGLKAVFAAMTAVAVLLAIWMAVPELLGGFIVTLLILAIAAALSAAISAFRS